MSEEEKTERQDGEAEALEKALVSETSEQDPREDTSESSESTDEN
ncbi:hypothetical protein [Natrinema gelatinilyticum]|nr:hypothetical protein [Natrinema gelatinilyticum]